MPFKVKLTAAHREFINGRPDNEASATTAKSLLMEYPELGTLRHAEGVLVQFMREENGRREATETRRLHDEREAEIARRRRMR